MSLPLAFVISFVITLMTIPVIIKFSKSVNLLDQPDKRKIHSISTPSMGGIAIFFGLIMALLFSIPLENLAKEKYFIGGSLMIFLLGVRDDISDLQVQHKLVVQMLSSVMVVFLAGVKIEGLNGLFGITNFPWYYDEIFTLFVLVVMTNAFNLIDGIDGLAGTIGLIISVSFCGFFLVSGEYFNATIALAMGGSVLAFLMYNWHPSKVFMGDAGSMVLGFYLTVLLIKFLQIPNEIPSQVVSPVAFVFSLFILPVYDTLRVFIIRLSSGKNPFSPDQNHIHHVLLKLGFNHTQSTLFLCGFNLFLIINVFFLQEVGELWLILGMSCLITGLWVFLDRKVIKRESARMASLVESKTDMIKSA